MSSIHSFKFDISEKKVFLTHWYNVWLICVSSAMIDWNISNNRKRACRTRDGNNVKCAHCEWPLPKGEPTDRAFPVCPIDRAKDFRLLIKIARALEFSIKRVATLPLLLSLFLIAVLFLLIPRLRCPHFHSVFSFLSVSFVRPSLPPRIFLACAFFLLRPPDALATLNAILRNASSEGTRIPMVSPDPLFAFWPLLWSARACGRVIFVSDNVSDSLSDDIEKYLLPRYLDARDRVQYSSITAHRGFSISTYCSAHEHWNI